MLHDNILAYRTYDLFKQDNKLIPSKGGESKFIVICQL